MFISRSFNKKWGTATGSRNIYVVYGVTSLKERAGTYISPTQKGYFRIKDLKEKWAPDLDDPKVDKAIKEQEELLKKVQ